MDLFSNQIKAGRSFVESVVALKRFGGLSLKGQWTSASAVQWLHWPKIKMHLSASTVKKMDDHPVYYHWMDRVFPELIPIEDHTYKAVEMILKDLTFDFHQDQKITKQKVRSLVKKYCIHRNIYHHKMHSKSENGCLLDQVNCDSMHWTFPQRQTDSNIFFRILEDHVSVIDPMQRTGLYAGGSIGLLAHEFLHMLGQHSAHWKIVNMDLCTPKQILGRIKKLAQIEQVKVPKHFKNYQRPEIVYVKGDLIQPCFRPNSFDFIDVSNVLGYLRNYKTRMNIMKSLWKSLKVGGYVRLVTPGAETLLEQMIVRKKGNRANDWRLAFVSTEGKSTDTMPAIERFERSWNLTVQILAIRGSLHSLGNPSKNFWTDLKSKLTDLEYYVLQDIYCLNPFHFGVGIPDLARLNILFPTTQTSEYRQVVLSTINQIQKKLVPRRG